MRTVERAGTRKELAREAGMGSVSAVSVLAGVLVAYGAMAVLAAIVAAVAGALNIDSADLSPEDWTEAGIGAAIALGAVLLVSYFFGGYVAGRMGRRAGLAHGLAVFVVGILIVAVVAGAAAIASDGDAVADELRNRGLPTSADDWRDVGLATSLGLLAAMAVGALAGGIKGERWHGLLVTRAQDPSRGPAAQRQHEIDLAAEERREADRREAERLEAERTASDRRTGATSASAADDDNQHRV